MTRKVCETCGRYQANHEDWDAMAPGEGEDLCWQHNCDGRDAPPPIPRLRVERWLRWYELPPNGRIGASSVLRAILAGEEPPE